MCKLSELKNLTSRLVHHLMNVYPFSVPVTCFVNQQYKRAVVSEVKFTLNMKHELSIKKNLRPQYSCLAVYRTHQKCFKTERKKTRKREALRAIIAGALLTRNAAQDDIRLTTKSTKMKKACQRLKFLKPPSFCFTANSVFRNCRLQNQSQENSSHILKNSQDG